MGDKSSKDAHHKKMLKFIERTGVSLNEQKEIIVARGTPNDPELVRVEREINENAKDKRVEQNSYQSGHPAQFINKRNTPAILFLRETISAHMDTSIPRSGETKKIDAKLLASGAIPVLSALDAEEIPLFPWEIGASRYYPIRRVNRGIAALQQRDNIVRLNQMLGVSVPYKSKTIDGTPMWQLDKYQFITRVPLAPLGFNYLGPKGDEFVQLKSLAVDLLKSYANLTLIAPGDPRDVKRADTVAYAVEFPHADAKHHGLLGLIQERDAPLRVCDTNSDYILGADLEQSVLYESAKNNQSRLLDEHRELRRKSSERLKANLNR